MQRDVIETMVAAELRKLGRPRTQDDICAISARIAVRLEKRTWTEERIFEAAAGMAAGVFGPAFERADYGQKAEWVDMCERELRKALHSFN